MNDRLKLYYQPPEARIIAFNDEDIIKTSLWGGAQEGSAGDFSGEYGGATWE